jgi:hypothetical protein
MSAPALLRDLGAALRGVRFARLLALLLLPLVLALASDWLRDERVVFPEPLPKFTTVPRSP